MLVCGAINVSIERVAYRPLRHAPRLAPLITAVGMSFVLEGLMFLWKGPFNLPYPNLLPTAGIAIGGGTNRPQDNFLLFLAGVPLVVLPLFVNWGGGRGRGGAAGRGVGASQRC